MIESWDGGNRKLLFEHVVLLITDTILCLTVYFQCVSLIVNANQTYIICDQAKSIPRNSFLLANFSCFSDRRDFVLHVLVRTLTSPRNSSYTEKKQLHFCTN